MAVAGMGAAGLLQGPLTEFFGMADGPGLRHIGDADELG
jgi:hypothetical protein